MACGLASGTWIAGHPPRHRLDGAVPKLQTHPALVTFDWLFWYRALPAVTAVGPHTFGLVVVDGVHLDEIFELEFGRARGPTAIAVVTGYQSVVTT